MAVMDSQAASGGDLSPSAQVLITIGVRGAPGRLLRQGTIGRVVREFSLHTVLSTAVHPDFMRLLADRRPGQFAEEKEIAELVSTLLSQEHRVFVNNLEEPIHGQQTAEVRVRDLLRQVPYPTVTMYSLHAKLEPAVQAETVVDAAPPPQPMEAPPVAAEPAAVVAPPPVAAAPPPAVIAPPAPPVVVPPVVAVPVAPAPPATEAPAPVAPTAAEPGTAVAMPPAAAPPAIETPVAVEEGVEEAEATFMEGAPPVPAPPAAPTTELRHIRGRAKVDALKERYHDVVMNLELKGLFAGNFGLEHVAEAGSRLGRLSEHALQEYLLSANFLRKARDFERAAGIYSILIKHDPNNPDYHFLLGKTYAEQGERERAMECFRAAVNLGHQGAPLEIARLEARSH